MKKLYQINISLPQKGFSLYEKAIQRILNTITDPWETAVTGLWGNGEFTLEIQILSTIDVTEQLKEEIEKTLGIEIEGDLT